MRNLKYLVGFFVCLLSYQNCGGPNAFQSISSSSVGASSTNNNANSNNSDTSSPNQLNNMPASACVNGQNSINPTLYKVEYSSFNGDNAAAKNSLMPIPSLAGTSYSIAGQLYNDLASGLKVLRGADKSDLTGDYNGYQSPISAIVYARYSPVNVTGEYYIVHGDNSTSAWVYRTTDHKKMFPLKFKPITQGSVETDSAFLSRLQQIRSLGEFNELRWDYTCDHPYRIYFIGRSLSPNNIQGETSDMSFYYTEFDPTTNVQKTPVVIHDFSKEFPTASYPRSFIMNDVEGDSSIDSRYWAWMVMDAVTSGPYQTYSIFTYDKQTNTVLSSIESSCGKSSVSCKNISSPGAATGHIIRPNMVEISPSGKRILVDWARVGDTDVAVNTPVDGPKAFLKDFSDMIRVGSDATHSGWAWGPNGEELFVSQNNRNDYIEAVNIDTALSANCSLIPNSNINAYTCGMKVLQHADIGYGGMHFGRFYDKNNKGFLFMNTYNTESASKNWFANQNLMIEINDVTKKASKILRLGSGYNQYDGSYRTEGSGALDMTGSLIMTTGNWGDSTRGDVMITKIK